MSETCAGINDLITKIAELEARITRSSALENRLLPTPHLLEILAQIGKQEQDARASDGAVAQSQGLSALVHQIIAQSPPPLSTYLLSLRQTGLLQAAEQWLLYLEGAADLDPAVFGILRRLLPDIARVLIDDPNALTRSNHPLRAFLEILLKICKFYDAYAGRRADQFMAKVARLANLAGSPLPFNAVYETAMQDLIALFNAHNAENHKLTQSFIARERGHSLQDDARHLVNRHLREAMEGRRLPLLFMQFLDQVWSKYLYITYLRNGPDDPEWCDGIEQTRCLAESLSIREQSTFFRYYASHVATALDRVKTAAFSIYQDESLVQRFLEQMNNIHRDILNGKEPDLGECVLVKTTSTPEDLSPDVHRQVAPLRPGDWYKLEKQGLKLRCALIEKNRDHAYCLFANFSGMMVEKYSFAQAAQRLVDGTLKRIDSPPLFEAAFTHACGELAKLLPRMEQQAAEIERARQELVQRQHTLQTEARLRKQEEEKLRKDEEARQEQLRKEQERLRQETEARAVEQQEARLMAVQRTFASITRMQPGGILELIEESGNRISCKLSLRIKSTGKLIFINDIGRKVAEFAPLQLAERIVDGSASIADYGVTFDDALTTLILDRSEKIQRDAGG